MIWNVKLRKRTAWEEGTLLDYAIENRLNVTFELEDGIQSAAKLTILNASSKEKIAELDLNKKISNKGKLKLFGNPILFLSKLNFLCLRTKFMVQYLQNKMMTGRISVICQSQMK